MEPTDLTIEILKDIRGELRELRGESRKTNERLDDLRTEMGEQLGEVNGRLERVERRQTETETRLATELIAVAGAVRDVRDLLRDDRVIRERVDDHERRLVAVERRAG
jgi:hypothetical protein